MRKTFATIYIKELKSYFGSLIAYIFAIIFFIILGSQFWDEIFRGGQITMRPFFNLLPILCIIFLPALTMKMWSEERRLGLDEIMLTLPIKPFAIITAKILGLFSFVVVLLAATLIFPYYLSTIGDLDWGPVIGSYIGSLFLSFAIISTGSFFSMITKNQIIAFLLSVLVISVLYVLGLTSAFSSTGVIAEILESISIKSNFDEFAKGVISLKSVVYFLSISGFMMYLSSIAESVIYWKKR